MSASTSPVETAQPPRAAPRPTVTPSPAPRARRPRRRLAAVLVVVAILAALGGGGIPAASESAHTLQSQSDALHARWAQMELDGVPAADLASLRSEWAGATGFRLFGAGSGFWLPGAKPMVDRWQASTDAIWTRNLTADRTSAALAEAQLRQALGSEPPADRAQRQDALTAASTPAQLQALRSSWDLEAKLVPADRRIASDFARLTSLVSKAAALGILSDPAGDVLADAKSYASTDILGRMAHAERLIRSLDSVQADLGARTAAAAIAQTSFGRLSAQISLATAYGMVVTAHRARLDTNRSLYAKATSASQFGAIATDVNATVATIQRSLNILRSQTHIISGVAVYFQSHALSCEETATSMALTHQHIYLSQNQILAEMGADLRPQYVDSRGILRWGNPYLSFVGSVDGVENKTGLQANYPALVRVARHHGARIIAYGYMSAEYIYARLTAGHPVVVYATWDWQWHPRHDYLSFDGRWIPYIGPAASHVYTAIGVRPNGVLVNDPIRGQYWVSKSAFQAAYGIFSEAIVFA